MHLEIISVQCLENPYWGIIVKVAQYLTDMSPSITIALAIYQIYEQRWEVVKPSPSFTNLVCVACSLEMFWVERNSNRDRIIKCFHDYPTVVESSIFNFHSNVNGLKNSTFGNTVHHVVSSR